VGILEVHVGLLPEQNLESIRSMQKSSLDADAARTPVPASGRWTVDRRICHAQGLGRLNIFLFSDSGAVNSVRRWLKLDGNLDKKTAEGLLRR
jgi:hypothetical protein